MLTLLLAVAEHAQASGRDFITSGVLAYEVCLRIADILPKRDFDYTSFQCLAIAMGASKLLGLSPNHFSQYISMAIVPNNVLRQVRMGHLPALKDVEDVNFVLG